MITKIKGCVKASRKPFMRAVALVSAIAVLCAVTAFAAAGEPYQVDIYDGSQITRVETNEKEPYTVVKEANIELSEQDKLILDEFQAGADSKITICRASNVSFFDADGNCTKIVFAGTVKELIAQQGVTLGEKLVSSVSVDAVVTDNMEVRILNSYNLTINVDGETRTVTSVAANVGELLDEQGIVLDGDDEVSPSAETTLSDGLTVNVLRVEYVTREAQEEVPYTTKTNYTSSMVKGASKVTTKGVNGTKTVVYKDKVVNGQAESSSVESETVTKQPVNEVKAVGTYVKPTVTGLGNRIIEKNGKPISEIALPSKYSVGANNVPTSYKYTIKGKAAAYCVPGGTTATGKPVKPGYIAVNPKQIPYGTEMWIVSDDGVVYGYAIAADTGGFAKKGTFVVDLYMSSTNQCYQWGSRNVTIYVL